MLIIVIPCLIIGIVIAVWWFISERRNYNLHELDRDRVLKALQQFFRPDWKKIFVFAIFIFIAFAGNTQTWAFSGRELGEPKPLFYDLLRGIPFWTIWIILLLPILLLSNLIERWPVTTPISWGEALYGSF